MRNINSNIPQKLDKFCNCIKTCVKSTIFSLTNNHLTLGGLSGTQRVFLEANRDLTVPSSNIICASICAN